MYMQEVSFLLILNYIGVCVFAFDGTRVLMQSNNSKFIAILAGLITAIGGGTLRDLLNGRIPFWIIQPTYILLSLLFSIISLYYLQKFSVKVLDYISTCVFAFSGTKLAILYGDSQFISLLTGILTALGGGTLRDIFNGQPPFWIKEPGYILVSLIFCLISLYYSHKFITSIPMYGI